MEGWERDWIATTLSNVGVMGPETVVPTVQYKPPRFTNIVSILSLFSLDEVVNQGAQAQITEYQ